MTHRNKKNSWPGLHENRRKDFRSQSLSELKWDALQRLQNMRQHSVNTSSNEKALSVFLDFMETMELRLKNSVCKSELDKAMLSVGIEKRKFKDPLPIYPMKQEILGQIANHQVCVIVAETGSGKSTQITQYLNQLNHNQNKLIVCTQPRKIAALSLAQRVAEELWSQTGDKFDVMMGSALKKFSKTVKIVYSTDSALLHEFIRDPLLSKFGYIIIDEAHERSLNTDVLLGMVKSCMQQRSDLKLVVTSATINPDLFINYFSCFTCSMVNVPGRIYAVETKWVPSPNNSDMFNGYVDRAVAIVEDICRNAAHGHILVFLTSPVETEKAAQMLATCNLPNLLILQLHGQLQPADQQLVFRPAEHGQRKVIFATNSAETSITVEGIRFVVDSGLVKEREYDCLKGTSLLKIKHISKSSAKQRQGRAGRTSTGTCHRMYSEEDFEQMNEYFIPEILRSDLGQTILFLKLMNVSDPLSFDFIEKPETAAFSNAMLLLTMLEALDSEGNLTDDGRIMAYLHLNPCLAKMLLGGISNINVDAAIETLFLVSVLNVGNLFYHGNTEEQKREATSKKLAFCNEFSDGLTFVNVFTQWLSMPHRERNAWCMQHSINAKATRACYDFCKELHRSIQKLPAFLISPLLKNGLRKLKGRNFASSEVTDRKACFFNRIIFEEL